MTVIGSASINIRADDKYFEPDVRRAVAKIKDLRVALKVDADMSAANKKLRDLRYRMSQNEVQIKIRANDVSFEADVRAAVRKIKNVSIDLKADVDSSKASKKIRDLRYRITSKPAILKVDANVAKAEEKMRKLLEKFTESTVNITAKAHTGEAHTALTDLQTRYGKNVNYTATAHTKVARAALALVARNRRAKITAFIDPATSKALQGAFNTITGTLPFDKVKASIVGVVGSFELLAVKAAAVGSVLLSVGSLALTAGANIFSIGGDMTQVVGIAAMLPAAFIAMGVAIATTKMAWKGFGEALSSDPKKAAAAMAELPPEAQKAADSVRGLGKEIQKATQAKFWEALGTSLQDMVTNLLPQAKEGFEYVGTAIGTLQAATFDNISKAFGDGVLLGMMTNIGDMFTNMTKGVGDFIQGMTTLGRVGATYLPQFGAYLSDAGIKFGEFIRKADEAGKINVWIDTAVRRFQELGSIVKSTTNIMSGLTEIARASGAPGLTEMANGFRNIADVVNGEPFQSQLRTILEGARTGTEALGEGLSTLTQLFWDSSESIGAFLKLGGEIAGLTFENITKLFDGTGLGTGLYEALQGFKSAMGDLGPAFGDLGDALGDLGRIAGELFRSMAPSLNMLAETIAGVVDGLADGIIAAMPIFNEFAQAILNLASGPLIALAQGIGNILTTFSELPGPIQTVIMSLGLLLLLKPKFDKFFGGMSESLAKETSRTGKYFREVSEYAADTRADIKASSAGMGESLRGAMDGASQSAGGAYRVIRTGAGEMAGEVKRAASSAGTAMSSAFGSAVAATKRALAPLAGAVRNTLMDEGGMSDVKKGFQDLSTSATQRMGDISDSAKRTASGVKNDFKGGLGATRDQFRDMGTYAQGSFKQLSSAVKVEGIIVKNEMSKMARAVDGALGNIPSRAGTAFGAMGHTASTVFNNIGARTQGVFTDLGGRAKTASDGVAGAFSKVGTQVGASIATINTSAGKVASGMSSALAPARLAMSDLAKHAATTGSAIGQGLKKGASLGAAGLMGALGGGWGAALAGATIAVAAWAQAQAESKARVEALTDVIGKQAGELGAAGAKMLATNLMDGATTKWDDFWRGAVKGAQSVEESFADLGVSLSDVGKKLADSSTRKEYAKGWDDISSAVTKGQKPTQAMLDAVGLTNKQLERLSNQDIGHLNGQLQGVAEEAEKAEIHAKNLADAHGVAGVMGARLSANYEILGDATSSVSEKTSAFRDNLDILAKGSMTTLEANSRYGESLRSTNEQLESLALNNGKTLSGLTNAAGAFDFANVASNDLYKTLDANKTSIIDMGIAVMQNAIDNDKSISVAKAEAVASMTESTNTLKQTLVNLGLDAEVAQKVLDGMGLNTEQFEAALVMKTDEANFNIAQSALAANAYANGEYAAALSAMPEGAKKAILSVTDYADAYANGGWEAVLTAIDQTGDGKAEVLSSLLSITDQKYLAEIEALDLTDDEFNDIIKKGGALSLESFKLTLGAEDDTAEAFNSVRDRTDTWEELKNVRLGVTDEYSVPLSIASAEVYEKWANSPEGELALRAVDETEGGVDAATMNVNGFKELTAEALLLAKNSAGDGLAEGVAEISPWAEQPSIKDLQTRNDAAAQYHLANGTIDQWDSAAAMKPLTTDNQAGIGLALATAEVDTKWRGLPSMLDLTAENRAAEGLTSAKGSVMSEWINNPNNKLGIFTEDQAMPGVISSKSTIENGLAGIAGGNGGLGRGVSVPISAEDLAAFGTASAANTMATGVTDQYRGIFANDGTAVGTASAQGTMNTLQDVYRDLVAFNQTAGATAESQATMETLQSVMRDLQAQDMTGAPLQASQATMNSLQSVTRDLQAQNLTGGPKGAAQGTMNSLQSVTRDLNANNQVGGPVGRAQGAINSVTGTEVDIVANDYASGPAENAAAAIGRVVGRTVDVVTNFVSKHFNAEGGLYNGAGEKVLANGGIMKSANNSAVQAFANGGINRGAQQQAIKAFAGGGVENHTAQIARGAWPVRIWAEPETGGEAYIPLSPNKRKRSLAILKEVMAEFGLEHLTHSFADGGLNKASRSTTPTVISSRYAAASTGSVAPAAQANTQMAAPIINVHPSQGLNEEQIGVIASDRLWFNIQNSSF